MNINKPMIDYVRLSGYSQEVADSLIARYVDKGAQGHIRMMDYTGQSFSTPSGSFASLSRKRNGKESHLISWSGELAHEEFHIMPKGWKATRIDVQLTIPETQHHEVLNAYNHAREFPLWVSSGTSPALKLIRSDTDTFYCGSRRSAKMIRMYTKLDTKDTRYTRLEWELKQDRAEWAIDIMRRFAYGDYGAREVYCNLVGQITSDYWLYGLFECANDGLLHPYTVSSKDRDTMTWLESLERSFGKVLAMHDTRARAHALIDRLHELKREYPTD